MRELVCVLRGAEHIVFQGNNSDLLQWLGCPVLLSQLMNQIQLVLKSKTQMNIPEHEKDVMQVAAVDGLARQIGKSLLSFMLGDYVSNGTYRNFSKALGRIKASTSILRVEWEKLLKAADAEDMEDRIE